MNNSPKHIAIILDGNRRFGQRFLGDALMGHKHGADKLVEVIEWCKEFDVRCLTVWAFSTENFGRSKEEVEALMNLLVETSKDSALLEKIHKNKIKVNAMGRIDLFPERVQEAIKKIVNTTKNYNEFTLNLALAYGGRQEIVDAARKLASLAKEGIVNPAEINKQLFSEQLYIVGLPDPDLIIRTGGSFRSSGFMLWQSEYSEWYYTDKLWPEFDRFELMKAIASFQDRDRRFGQ